MANGQILRGEVYWICVDDSVGSEQQTGRPAVILSGNKSNENCNTVIVAFLTTKGGANYYSVSVNYTGKPERVLCNQVRTIDKQRLTRYIGKLTEPEMRRVNGGLAVCMCIPTSGDAVELDPFDKDESEELITLKAEADMWKRLYEATMNQLVDFKVDADLKMRLAQREPVVVEKIVEVEKVVEVEKIVEVPAAVEPEPVVEPEPEPEPEKVDLNNCTVEDLKKCGCTEVVARTIVSGRPYTFVDDLTRIPGITNVGFNILKHKVCVNPMIVEEEPEEPEVVEVVEEPEIVEETPVDEALEKVNINTATAKELMEKLGIGVFYAYSINSYRNKNGRFVDLKELLEVPKLSKAFYERYKDRLTIGEDEEPVAEEPEVAEETDVELLEDEADPQDTNTEVPDKVNVNTASAQEIHDVTGLEISACYVITGKRKREGLFKSLDELITPPRITAARLAKFRDKMTIGEPQPEQPKSDKLNINTASLRELMDVGFEKRAAALIVNERRRFGNYRSVDDLSEIPEISGKILRKLRDKLEV